MKYALLVLVTTALMLAGTSPVAAAECVDVSFPDQISVGGDTLTLNGLGLREATMFDVDVYVAGLYVPQKSRSGSKLVKSNTKKRLILRFVREVEKSKVRDAIKEGIEKSKFGPTEALRAKAKKISSWMGSVEEGDTYTYTYVPGEGVTVEFNNTTKGTIKGAKFAQAFFDIWLGANPPNEGLKTGLLGGSCD
jgi:hypothetical protein